MKEEKETIPSYLGNYPKRRSVVSKIAIASHLSSSPLTTEKLTSERKPMKQYLFKAIENLMVENAYHTRLTKKEQNQVIESIRTKSKINRNSLCPCKSGKKYKVCCKR